MENDKKDEKNVVDYAQFLLGVRTQLQSNYREEIAQITQYVQNLMSILGVIAGFGFTAFDHIENKYLFFSGEALVIFSILFLLFKVKRYVIGQPMSTEAWINDSMEKVKAMKMAILSSDLPAIRKFSGEFEDRINSVTKSEYLNFANQLNTYLGTSLYSGSLGIVLIVLSFLVC